MSVTLTCAFAQWSPGIGDNTPVGWLTVAVYLGAAWAAARAAGACAPTDPLGRRERLFWWAAAVLLLALAINKQLDLQTFVTAVARCHAQLSGWYEQRREVQRLFIFAVAGGSVLGLLFLTVALRRLIGRVWLALVGLGFVCAFVAIRAASFHRFDTLIGTTISGFRMNWLLELPGPILVILVALRRVRAARNRSDAAISNQE